MKYQLTSDYHIVPVSGAGKCNCQCHKGGSQIMTMNEKLRVASQLGAGKKTVVKTEVKPKRKPSPAVKKRGELVKRIMKKHGVNLPTASKMLSKAMAKMK